MKKIFILAYTISGLPATESSRGIIIQNGQKTMVK